MHLSERAAVVYIRNTYDLRQPLWRPFRIVWRPHILQGCSRRFTAPHNFNRERCPVCWGRRHRSCPWQAWASPNSQPDPKLILSETTRGALEVQKHWREESGSGGRTSRKCARNSSTGRPPVEDCTRSCGIFRARMRRTRRFGAGMPPKKH